MSKETVKLDSKREIFWDDYMLEPEKTTAKFRVHPPVKKECVLTLDEDWEGDGCDYYNILRDDDVYRMYYLGWWMINPGEEIHSGSDIKVCYAESKDGIHWYKPILNLCEWNGSKENNIILGHETDFYDNFFAFKDTNPDCDPAERYKGLASSFVTDEMREKYTIPEITQQLISPASFGLELNIKLWSYVSADGIHWHKKRLVTEKGTFDTLNTALWDEKTKKYYCYIRDFHDNAQTGEKNIRDIRLITSDDFVTWTDPVLLDFCGGDDYPLYTNVITQYYRAPHIWTGFPTRYVERHGWTKNTDRLCGAVKRRYRCQLEDRLGMAVTDCVFMSSRDGLHWHRFDEAWMTPGAENGNNWVYGDCYPALGMIQTKSEYENADDVISTFCFEGKWTAQPSKLYRYESRLDGFASLYGEYKGDTVTTRPFTFSGDTLKVNFASSAIGNMYVKVLDKDYNVIDGYESCEIYGDKVDRVIDFDKSLSELKGKQVRLQFLLSDCNLYSFIIE